MDAKSEPGTEPEGCDCEPDKIFDLIPLESDADEETFEDNASLDDRNFNITQFPLPSPAPATWEQQHKWGDQMR